MIHTFFTTTWQLTNLEKRECGLKRRCNLKEESYLEAFDFQFECYCEWPDYLDIFLFIYLHFNSDK